MIKNRRPFDRKFKALLSENDFGDEFDVKLAKLLTSMKKSFSKMFNGKFYIDVEDLEISFTFKGSLSLVGENNLNHLENTLNELLVDFAYYEATDIYNDPAGTTILFRRM